jgi:Transposase
MKRSRFSEEQIIGRLKEHRAGLSPAELCRKHGKSDATFYTWRKKYGGMEVYGMAAHHVEMWLRPGDEGFYASAVAKK